MQEKAEGIILGIDWGRKYIGIARSDESQTMAFPFEVVDRSKLQSFLIDQYKRQRFVGLVFGLPKELDGSELSYADAIRLEAKKLVDMLAVPDGVAPITLDFIDERFTSSHVQGGLDKKLYQHKQSRNEGFASSAERKDAQAAALILQRYLDQRTTKH
jgi:putative holliday junction resolvase